MEFLNSLRVMRHLPSKVTNWDTEQRVKLLNQTNMFIKLLSDLPKKFSSAESHSLGHYFKREYLTAYNIAYIVRKNLISFKNYCETGLEFTNEIYIIRESILKGKFLKLKIRNYSYRLAVIFCVSKEFFSE